MLAAIYKDTKDKCWINMDYVIDIFQYGKDYIAYTIDSERGGYIIEKDILEDWFSIMESNL